ncbi:MAG TPA: hypothetical protein VI685_17485 [Candidatus Angelobacter sp.]
MSARLLFLLLLISTLTGCTPADSINPLLTDKDIYFDQGLLGMWGDKESSPKDGYLLFEKAGDNGYRITVVDEKGSKQGYAAYLGYLRGQRFLDVVPDPATAQWSALEESDLTITQQGPNATLFKPTMVKVGDATYLEFANAGSDASQVHFKLSLRSAHWLCKLATEGSIMRLDCLDEDWVKNHIDDPGVHLAHEPSSPDGSGLVVTASTADLQRLVTEHAEDKEAFSWSMTATRLSGRQ